MRRRNTVKEIWKTLFSFVSLQSRTCPEVRAGGHCDLRDCRKLQAGLAVLQLIHISNNSLGAEIPLLSMKPCNRPMIWNDSRNCLLQKLLLSLCLIPSVPPSAPCCSQSYSHQGLLGRSGNSGNHVNLCLKSSTRVTSWCRKVTASRPSHGSVVKAREEVRGNTRSLSITPCPEPGGWCHAAVTCSSLSGRPDFGLPACVWASTAELAGQGMGKELAAFSALLEPEGRRSWKQWKAIEMPTAP